MNDKYAFVFIGRQMYIYYLGMDLGHIYIEYNMVFN